ncbi:MAG: beta strand repeat-containing protein, partial [Chthoniobacterales bacterium]
LPVQTNAVADYYFVKITETNLPGFRNKLIDYYIEATDNKTNVSRSDIQHVWVDDFSGALNTGGGGGGGGTSNNVVTLNPAVPVSGQPLTVTYSPIGRALASATSVNIHHGFNQNITANWTPLPGVAMTKSGSNWVVTYNVASNATTIAMCFNNGSGTWDNNGGGNWNFNVTNAPLTNAPPAPIGLSATGTSTNTVSLSWASAPTASGYVIYRNGFVLATNTFTNFLDTGGQADTEYTYEVVATNSVGNSPPSASVTARTFFAPVPNNNIRLVNPSNGATIDTNIFTFRGHAGLGLTNGLQWSNSLSGQTGSVAFTGVTNSSGWSWEASLPITNGSNNFVFTALYPTNGLVQQTGSDSPTNYSGWSNSSSNGLGFGAWTITTSNGSAGSFLADSGTTQLVGSDGATNYGVTWTNGSTGGTGFDVWSLSSGGSGAFILANPTNGSITGMGAKAFQLRAPAGGTNTFATANRAFSQPMSVGQALSFQWGMNWDCGTTNGAKGFSLFAGTNELVNVNNGSTEAITCNGVNIQFGYGVNAMRWTFKLLTASSLEVRANDRDGNGTFTTNLTISSAPTSVRFYAANMEPSANREPYFDEFQIEGPANGNMDVGSTKGFGLWANSGGSVTARRNLPATFDSGDSLTIRIDNNWIDTGNRVGLALATAGGSNRFNFYFIGGQSTYRIDDSTTNRDSGLAYTETGLLLTLTMTASNSYSLNTGASVLTGTLGAGGPITQLVTYNNNAGTGTERNFYVGGMSFTEQQTTNALTTLSAPSIVLQALTDGLPDDWWAQYGIIGTNRVAATDPDSDGFDNAKEHALGTDPANSSSTFRITSIAPGASSTTVTWSSVAGKRYSLQGATNLGTLSWSNIGSAVSATNHSTSTNHATSVGQHFYRVILAQ